MVKLQNALQDARTAKSDDILFTVLLMRMLEVYRLIAFSSCFSNPYTTLLSLGIQIPTATSHVMPTPFKHIHGAMTLVNLRGLQNFSSDVAIRLFGYIKVALVRSKRLFS